MKKNTRFIATFLVLLMAGGTLLSCGDSSEQDSQQTNSSVTETETAKETVETEPPRTQHGLNLEALDFGEDTLDMLACTWAGYNYYFFASEETGDAMNDAIYRRARTVEDALNIKIVTHMDGFYINEVFNELKTTVLAADDAYDMVFNHCITGISASSSEGYLYNLDEMPHINMQAEWWNREQMDVLRLGENTYFAVNDMMIPAPYVMFFNRDIINNYDMENPYDLVRSGKWTLDVCTEMMREVTLDVNGDGTMDVQDSYGLACGDPSEFISFMTGADQYMTGRDADGRVTLALNTDKMVSLMSLFAELAKDKIIYSPNATERISFNSGRLLFQTGSVVAAEQMRDYTINFGFLPFPKYDEAQENYLSLDWGGLMSVPATIGNPDMVGAAMELLAWESANEVIPTYYDKVLDGKLARDQDTEAMLDLLFDTITYEVGGNYFGFDAGTNTLFYVLPDQAIKAENDSFASVYAKYEKAANRTIENFYKKLDKIENSN